jgi:hypothetical protein
VLFLGGFALMQANTIELAGRVYENATALKERLGISEFSIRLCVRGGMAMPIKVGRARYFDRELVDLFITGTPRA